jgi:hypothetical protein
MLKSPSFRRYGLPAEFAAVHSGCAHLHYQDQWCAAERPSECEIISELTSAQSNAVQAAPFGLPCCGEHLENDNVVDVLGSVRKGLLTPGYGKQEASAVGAGGAKRSSPDRPKSSCKRRKLEVNPCHSKKLPTCNNRIFTRIMTPIGRTIERFASYQELLGALIDAIRGEWHRCHLDLLHGPG